MATILYVEDDAGTRESVAACLRAAGHGVVPFGSGAGFLRAVGAGGFDLVILDIAMAGADGFALLERLRAVSAVPAIMLTALVAPGDRCRCLDGGADRYLEKPVPAAVLVAEVEAQLRRASLPPEAPVETPGDLSWDASTASWSVRGRSADLTRTEGELLSALCARFGAVVSRPQLLQEVWGLSADAPTRVLDETLRRLRAKLLRADSSVALETVWGVGVRAVERELP